MLELTLAILHVILSFQIIRIVVTKLTQTQATERRILLLFALFCFLSGVAFVADGLTELRIATQWVICCKGMCCCDVLVLCWLILIHICFHVQHNRYRYVNVACSDISVITR
jgi:hypothetical protein